MATTVSKVIGAFKGFSSITGIISAVHSAFSKFSTFLGGPWAIVIAGVVAAAILVYTHWDDIKKLWEEKIKPAIESLKKKFDDFIKFIKDEVEKRISELKKKFEELKKYWAETFEKAIDSVKTTFDNLKKYWSDTFEKAIDNVKTKFDNFKQKVEDVKTKVVEFKEKAIEVLYNFIKDKLIGTVEKIAGAFTDFWDNHLGPVATKVRDTFNPIIGGIETTLGAINSIMDTLGSTWDRVWNWMSSVISNSPIGGFIDGIKEKAQNALKWLADLLNANNQQTVTYNPPASTTAPNAYGGTIYAPVSNGIAAAESASSYPLPDDVVLKAPLMARGGVIPPNAPFLAVLGDQRSGTNVEAPLATIEQAVRNAMGGGGGRKTTKLTVTLDRRVLFDAMIDAGKDNLIRTGNNAFEMG